MRRGPCRRAVIAGLPVAGLAAPGLAAGLREWRMVTAWPRDLPGPGISARRFAESVTALSGGRLAIRLYAAGELAPGPGVLDAVEAGTAEIGHTAGVFHAGRAPAAALFTAAPFGLTPVEHLAWIETGGGQAHWDALYADWRVVPMLAGNTGPSMGGWFRRPVGGLDDLAGRRMRIAGLGARLMERLGVVPTAVAPGEIFTALVSGAIDAAEFASPAADLGLGLYDAARHYYGPGFHEPNGAGEAIVGRKAWDVLEDDLKALVRQAAAAEHARALADAHQQTMQALAVLAGKGVMPELWPADVVAAAAEAAPDVMADLAATDAASRRIVDAYDRAVADARRWSALSLAPFLAARG